MWSTSIASVAIQKIAIVFCLNIFFTHDERSVIIRNWKCKSVRAFGKCNRLCDALCFKEAIQFKRLNNKPR